MTVLTEAVAPAQQTDWLGMADTSLVVQFDPVIQMDDDQFLNFARSIAIYALNAPHQEK